VPLKRHSGNSWRSTEESGILSGTWWRARRGIWPNWRGLGPRWSGDGARKKRMEMKRRGLRMALEKVRRGGLRRLPPVRLVVLFFPFLIEFIFSVN